MDQGRIIDEAKAKFSQAVQNFQEELKKLRTGRAHASMLDGVVVQAYGTPMPLKQVANVTAPEAQLLQVTPFDPSNINAITSAIRENQTLGLNPSDDGRIIRIPIPALTEERRREITKQVSAKQEDCMIRMRSVRHDAIDAIDKAKKDKTIGEDDAKRLTSQVGETIAKAKSEAESAAKTKEQEIMTI